MKAIAASIAAALMLAGCGQTTPSVDSEALSVVVGKIQKTAVEICKFLPTDETVVKIITASAPGETAYTIAEAICKAVMAADTEGAPSNAAGRAQCPMTAGVCIEGQFVTEAPKE